MCCNIDGCTYIYNTVRTFRCHAAYRHKSYCENKSISAASLAVNDDDDDDDDTCMDVYVTNNAANMKAAFREELWLGCSRHNLNLVLSHVLQAPKEGCPGCPPKVQDLITVCKDLVTLAKKTRLNSKLETTLKQCVSTRWNSVLFTLQSVQRHLTELKSVASDPGANRNLMRLLGEINEDWLHDIIQLLLPFDNATKALSVDKSPPLHLVLPTKIRLQKHLSPVGSDCEVIAELRQ